MSQHKDIRAKVEEANVKMDNMKGEIYIKMDEMKKEISDIKRLMISLIFLIKKSDVSYTLDPYDAYSSPTPINPSTCIISSNEF